MNGLKISQVAKESNVHIETIRYYERRELIAIPPRTENGYKMYTYETVEDIKFIKSAQEIGFTLGEIKQILALYKEDVYYPTEEMYQFSIAKVKEIEGKIIQLNNFKTLLELVTKHPFPVQPLSKEQCPVIKTILKG